MENIFIAKFYDLHGHKGNPHPGTKRSSYFSTKELLIKWLKENNFKPDETKSIWERFEPTWVRCYVHPGRLDEGPNFNEW